MSGAMTQPSVGPTTPARLVPGGRHAQWRALAPAYVALDVDGTLVTGAEVPERSVLDAIERLVGLGVRVGLATGRMAAANGPLLATGVFTGPHVFHNGAVVRDGAGHHGAGSDLLVEGLDEAAVEGILAFGREREDVSVEVYVSETYLTDRDDPRSAPHGELLRLAPSGRIRSAGDLQGHPAIKAVIVCFSDEAATDAVDAANALGLEPGPAASPATPQLRYVNVTRRGVDKGSGVRAAASMLGIELEHVAAIGDETNDLPVLGLVGTAIAMGDAGAAVRSSAHLIAPRFADGGTAAALGSIGALIEMTLERPDARAQ